MIFLTGRTSESLLKWYPGAKKNRQEDICRFPDERILFLNNNLPYDFGFLVCKLQEIGA